MKKQNYITFLLFAALSGLVVMTSCKDYDDDILQLQTDSATKVALEAAISELNTLKAQLASYVVKSDVDAAVATAKTEAIEEAIEEANKMLDGIKGDYDGTLANLAALITVLNGDVSALGVNLDEVELKVAANKTAIELQQAVLEKYLLVAGDDNVVNAIIALQAELANTFLDIGQLSDKVDTINRALNVLNFSIVNQMITGVTFAYEGYGGSSDRSLIFKTSPARKSWLFGEGLTGAIEFVKDERATDNESMIELKVSPVNTDVSQMLENIYLVRRDGNNEINSYIKAVKAERSAKLRNAPSVTGLWDITFSIPSSVDMTDLESITRDEEGEFLFAVAIENSVEMDADSEKRYIISEFGLKVNAETAIPVYNSNTSPNLDFLIGTEPDFVSQKEIRNRYLVSETGVDTPADKRWAGTGWTPEEATENDVTDNRSSLSKAFFAVEVEKPFNLKLEEPEGLFAYYIALDTEWALENAPYELNSWMEYNYSGMDRVYEAGEIAEIKINSSVAIGDVIGFRVFAVNFDGTLVDPDGKSFYVTVGARSSTWNDVSTVVTALNSNEIEPFDIQSKAVEVHLTKLATAASYEWTTDKADNPEATSPAFKLFFVDEEDAVLFSIDSGSGTIPGSTDFSKVAAIYTSATVNNWLAYIDNKIYNGTLKIKNSSGNLLVSMNTNFKKVLPAEAPEGFTEKTGQFTNGVYNGYLIPAVSPDGGMSWNEMWSAATGATHGMMHLDQLFNFGSGELSNFETTFTDSDKLDDEMSPVTVIGSGPVAVAREFIDDKTSHVTTVQYNYGLISTVTPDKMYKVTVKEFRTIYNNIYNNTFSWNWATREQLGLDDEEEMPYTTEVTYGTDATVNLAHIFGVSSRDSRYNAALNAPYKESLSFAVDEPAKLVTAGVELVEYFNVTISGDFITLTGKSGATNPTIDVPSVLIITAKDMYGKNVEINLPMTVKKR